MKRIGLVGCGAVANYGHLPAISETDGLELHALLDPDEQNLKAAQQRFQVPYAFTDPQAFYSSGIDAVVITSPAPCHFQNVLDAIRCGKPILCEKPLAMTEEEGNTMIAAAEAAGIPLFLGFTYRFSLAAQQIKALIRQKAIGDVRAVRLIYIWNLHGKYEIAPDGQRIPNPRREARMEEGGPMVDCGVHQIDLARWWLEDEIIRVSPVGIWVDNYEAPDHMVLHLDHEHHAHTLIEISYSYCHTAQDPISHFTYQIVGTEGLIRYDRELALFEVRSNAGTQFLPFSPEKNFAGMYEAFARALETGERGDLPTGRDGLIVTSIARRATDQVINDRKLIG